MAVNVLEEVRVQLVEGLEESIINKLLDVLRKEGVLNKLQANAIVEGNPVCADKARKLVDSITSQGSAASEIMIAQLKICNKYFYENLKLDERLRAAGVRTTPGAPAPGAPALGASAPGASAPGTSDTDDGSKEYTMKSDPRGLCVIINNAKFQNPKKNRKGSDKDAALLKKTFEDLGFKVLIHENRTAEQMSEHMLKYSNSDEHRDCFVCCILSHGNQEGVSGTDLKTCSMKDILSPFDGTNCCPLAGKPKVFFIQACRGQCRQVKVHVTADDDATEEDDDSLTSDDPGEAYTLPKHSDYLVSMSTVEDYVSYRTNNGSWFIESLCSHLVTGSGSGKDILAILTEVNDEVSKKEGKEKINEVEYDAKMTPELRSTLRKKLIFPPKSLTS